MVDISRRGLMAATAAFGIAASAIGARPKPTPRPNILWLVSEDNNPFIGAYGDRQAHTPAIDALAAKGVLFRNVYSTAPVCAPSRYALITGASPEGNAPANHMRAQAKLPEGWRTTPEFMREAGYYTTNNFKTDYNCEIDEKAIWDDNSSKAHWSNRPEGKPFFSIFNFMTTHESQMFRATAGRLRPQDVTVPPHLPDTPEVRLDIASYYNLIEKMDGQVAKHLAALEAAGLSEDTIVFYYSDNGGCLPKSKRYCSDAGLRVALVAYYPPKWQHLAPAGPGQALTAPVTLMDLPPTILRIAGHLVPSQMEGRPLVKGASLPRYAFGMLNRMDERYDFVRSVTDGRWRYTRNYLPHLPSGQHGAYEWQAKSYQSLEREYLAGRLTEEQARFFKPRPFEELYDLSSDPHELSNLAAHPSGREKLKELRTGLDQHMLAINDNGFIPEGSPLEGYSSSRRAGAYPLRSLMALGAKAARRDAGNLSAFVAGLNDRNEVVRYWNANALAMLGASASPAMGALQARLEVEPSAQVRVALAEAMGYVGSISRAESILLRLLEETASLRVKLQVVNALTHIGAKSDATLAVLKEALKLDDEYVPRAAIYQILIMSGEYQPQVDTFAAYGRSPKG
ncbi:sulfatase-like hydrolase/transferase [Sphingobium sp. EP60837]|uniref:sulfatase-like hydrolase/transferase n=1 Tax=Sphingobium sp. EP60837 TaxID=1855519 RepID=UPI0007DDE78B|nr:sulfatase-like hydrolase/transferase [Sphingobium sp. EP60837]ANI77283.1 Iduronate-2-sulfatase [Sphingobium sp. EP60837]